MVDKKEVREAKTAARQVLSLLNEVEAKLKSAKNWGIYDLLGGGFFSSMIKHRKIDQAESLLRDVQSGLVRLQKELGDINLSIDSSVGVTGFERFLDIAFDNVVFDWMTQTRVNDSLREVSKLQTEIQGILRTLDLMEME
ncbi:MAG: hypothetical protein GX971_11595 [Firmicutes bacterium]|nr:hypothetical protein [Bacillota bacterium]